MTRHAIAERAGALRGLLMMLPACASGTGLAAVAPAATPAANATTSVAAAPAHSTALPAIAASSSAAGAASAARSPEALLRPAADDLAVGNINGIKVAIPRYLLESGVYYQGRVSPTARKKKDRPTYQSSIESFDIVLRLSTLQPIRTKEDLRDHRQSQSMPPTDYSASWATVDVSPAIYPIEGSLRVSFANWQQDLPHGGAVTRQPDTLGGLVHAVSTEAVDNRGQRINRQYDYYFDESRWTTFMYCQTDRTRGAAPSAATSDCKLDFVIPDFRVFAEAQMTLKDVSRWRDIESATRDVLHSVVVNP